MFAKGGRGKWVANVKSAPTSVVVQKFLSLALRASKKIFGPKFA
jgi:hypothetical protein